MNEHAADALSTPVPAVFPIGRAASGPPPTTDREREVVGSGTVSNAGESAVRLSNLLSGLGDVATGELPLLLQSDGNETAPVAGASANARSTAASDEAAIARRYENRLAMVRLGMATSLFYALRTKHSPTAAHSLRVALSCSAWCERLGLDAEQRDRIEVAALLHDIGKIGIPDRVLRKSGKLSVEEQMSMDGCAGIGCDILRGSTDDQRLLDIVRYCGTWYESRRQDDSIRGEAIPLGARMLSIAGAFDAMTTDQVYRPAMSRERALQELFRGSNTQFDPELVRDFATMLEKHPEMLHECVVDRWLQQLNLSTNYLLGHPVSDSGRSGWGLPKSDGQLRTAEELAAMFSNSSTQLQGDIATALSLSFFQTLTSHLRDGVAFTDREGQILFWNESMAHVTRIAAIASIGQQWDSAALHFVGNDKDETDLCPVTECLQRRIVVTRSMKLVNVDLSRSPGTMPERLIPGKPLSEFPGREVLIQASPVGHDQNGGAVVIVRDISDRAEMQNQIQSLHKKATSDPLTGIANRAEFDQRLVHCTTKAKLQGITFSLIMCDIDHFKKVNDVHGHQAGDEALIQFANVLERHTRGSDLVARYGGEEFAFIAINSDNATTTRRAEEIRKAVSITPLKGLGGQSVTVSIGVTEYQTGDAPETIVARADRALMQAKENGRNRVVQLGSGMIETEEKAETTGWWKWLTSHDSDQHQHFELATPVPTDLAVEKLRGFIADHQAEIVSVTGSELSLRLMVHGGTGRRAADHQMTLNTLIRLREVRSQRGHHGSSLTQTQISVTVTPVRGRDRRSASYAPCVRQVINSLKSYLMAEIVKQNG